MMNGERKYKRKVEESTEDPRILFVFKIMDILYAETFFI